MKFSRYKKLMIRPATVVSLLTVLVSSAFAENFNLRSDGSVDIGGQSFVSFKEYVSSEYFRTTGKRCSARMLNGSLRNQPLEKNVADCTVALTQIKDEYWPAEIVYVIPVWWHVIYKRGGMGSVSYAQIRDQMQVLNEDFRALADTMGSRGFDVKIQFELAGITRTVNSEWFTDSKADEIAYKRALAKDTTRYLNVYTNDAGGVLGYAYFPQQGGAGSVLDGIVLFYETVGGRNNGFSQYDQGRTLVHEVGHYLGLVHTFSASFVLGDPCSNSYSSGDLIVDTNAESEPHFKCSQTLSCGSPDPIHNYMNYTPDTCMYEFTAEQANRSVCGLVNYRPQGFHLANSGGVTIPPFLSPLILAK